MNQEWSSIVDSIVAVEEDGLDEVYSLMAVIILLLLLKEMD